MCFVLAFLVLAMPAAAQPVRYSLPPKAVLLPTIPRDPPQRETFDPPPAPPGTWKGIDLGGGAHLTGTIRSGNNAHRGMLRLGHIGQHQHHHHRSSVFGPRVRAPF